MEDQLKIKNLVYKYADAVCRRSKEDWASTWHEEAIWELPSAPKVEGKDKIVNFWVEAMSNFPFAAQLIQNGTVEVNGNNASGRWYIVEHLQFADKTGMFNIGVYQDKYLKVSDEWLFKERYYNVLYNDNGTGNMTGTINPYPDLID